MLKGGAHLCSYGDSSGKRAIVVGAGIAWLLAARVLADWCFSVTVIERDTPAAGARDHATRGGVPQSAQAHLLLYRGYRIITRLFPRIEKRILGMGGQKIDFMVETRIYIPSGGRWCSSDHVSDIHRLGCSRRLLESAMRAELARDYSTRTYAVGASKYSGCER
ncbi:MAG: hypothetical protein C4292_02075 [Nitrososphaera sp.]